MDELPGPWKLIVCEDADEYLRPNTRPRSSAAPGRLLSATTGSRGDAATRWSCCPSTMTPPGGTGPDSARTLPLARSREVLETLRASSRRAGLSESRADRGHSRLDGRGAMSDASFEAVKARVEGVLHGPAKQLARVYYEEPAHGFAGGLFDEFGASRSGEFKPGDFSPPRARCPLRPPRRSPAPDRGEDLNAFLNQIPSNRNLWDGVDIAPKSPCLRTVESIERGSRRWLDARKQSLGSQASAARAHPRLCDRKGARPRGHQRLGCPAGGSP